MHAIDVNNNKSYKFKIYDLGSSSTLYNPSAAGYTTMIHLNEFSIPNSINKQLKTQTWNEHINFKYNSNGKYSIFFKCAGYDYDKSKVLNQCNAIIFNKFQMYHQNKEEIGAIAWSLPALPIQGYGNSVVYCNKYGLISIGNSENLPDIYHLKFKKAKFPNWKWEILAKMSVARCYTQSVLINNDDKLLIVSGELAHRGCGESVELLDLTTKQWSKVSSCLHPRYYGGITYNKDLQRVYLGGGINADRNVEYYNIEKDKWYELCETKLIHETNPTLYCLDRNTLYIGSVASHGLEWIDIRDQQKKWNIVYDENTLSDTFGLRKTDETNFRKWMICG